MPQLARRKLYHWEGRSLLLDTVVHYKRTVPLGRQTLPCPFDIRRWIMPPDDEMMGRTWQRLSRGYRQYVQSVGSSNRADAKAKSIWHFLVEHITYIGDGRERDHWQFPSETLTLRQGDCEDKAFLCASLLLSAGIAPSRVRVTIGAMVSRKAGSRQPSVAGHAWPMYCNARGIWCILEPNVPHLPTRLNRSGAEIPRRRVSARRSVFMSADRFASDEVKQQYVPLVCLNHQSVWSVEQTNPGLLQGASILEPNWDQNPTFDEILAWNRRKR